MDKRLRKYYYAAVVNLFLWFPLLPFVVFPHSETVPLYHNFRLAIVVCGVALGPRCYSIGPTTTFTALIHGLHLHPNLNQNPVVVFSK